MYTWNLDKLYTGFNDPKFANDLLQLDKVIDSFTKLSVKIDKLSSEELIKSYLDLQTSLELVTETLFAFCSLTLSTDSTNKEARNKMVILQTKTANLAKPSTIIEAAIAKIGNIDEVIAKNEYFLEHQYLLKKIVLLNKYDLDENVEEALAKLRSTASTSWSQMTTYLTSNLEVNYAGKKIGLAQVRNLAYDTDPAVRKEAYFAELDSYNSIKDAISFSLNSIKGEVNTVTKLRGYNSPLEQSLIQCSMKKETLTAMQEAIISYLPKFEAYLKRKAELLGHKDGLPWYDLFAPIGKLQNKYSVEEANNYILNSFSSFSEKLANFANIAFENNWIDYLPKAGKSGGAFCANLNGIKESRFLLNFGGDFGDVITLAHELGHGYHGYVIQENSLLNTNYPIVLAETASTFLETIVLNDAIASKNGEELIYLIENDLQGATQIICDIHSRYLFEDAVFSKRQTQFVSSDELCNIMLESQKAAYGKGLDHNTLHKYMWVCKSHYYSSGRSYYNYPYAFGMLFSKGLYAKYLENKQEFVKIYDQLLRATGLMEVEEVAKVVGIDLTKKEFWLSSLEVVGKTIDKFLEITS